MTLQKLLFAASVTLYVGMSAWAPTNFFVPYDPNLKMPAAPKKQPTKIGAVLEYGDSSSGYNWDGKKTNILQLNDADQAIIPMLINSSNTDARTLLQCLTNAALGQPLDDGIRGHVIFTGDFEQLQTTVFMRHVFRPKFIPGSLALSVHMPIIHTEVDNIKFTDKTTTLLRVDSAIKQAVSDPAIIQSKIKALGLDIYSWSKTGAGDLDITLDWSKDFAQDKSALKNVELNAFIGVSCPTSDERDEDKAFSLPLGNDGAWALPLGLGLDLDFKYHIALGVAAQFDIIFDHSKIRRMKTETHQTEFLLLDKGDAEKDYGLTWRLNAYLQGYRFWRGLSLKAAYEYTKHDSDELHPHGTTFNTAIVNTANSLKEWNTQNVVFMMNYDFFQEFKTCSIKPQISLFYKLNCDGKRVIASDTFGGQLAFTF